jgi:hypothetical protein
MGNSQNGQFFPQPSGPVVDFFRRMTAKKPAPAQAPQATGSNNTPYGRWVDPAPRPAAKPADLNAGMTGANWPAGIPKPGSTPPPTAPRMASTPPAAAPPAAPQGTGPIRAARATTPAAPTAAKPVDLGIRAQPFDFSGVEDEGLDAGRRAAFMGAGSSIDGLNAARKFLAEQAGVDAKDINKFSIRTLESMAKGRRVFTGQSEEAKAINTNAMDALKASADNPSQAPAVQPGKGGADLGSAFAPGTVSNWLSETSWRGMAERVATPVTPENRLTINRSGSLDPSSAIAAFASAGEKPVFSPEAMKVMAAMPQSGVFGWEPKGPVSLGFRSPEELAKLGAGQTRYSFAPMPGQGK